MGFDALGIQTPMWAGDDELNRVASIDAQIQTPPNTENERERRGGANQGKVMRTLLYREKDGDVKAG